jgi:hypothetical protein
MQLEKYSVFFQSQDCEVDLINNIKFTGIVIFGNVSGVV